MRWALVLVAGLLLACATPAAAQESYVDLVVTASYDKKSYLSTEDATLTVTIINAGTAPATGVLVTATGDPTYPTDSWGEFDPTGPGGSVGPGDEVVLTAAARPFDPGDGIRQLVQVTSAEPDQFGQDNEVVAEAGGTEETCDAAVVLFGDADRDGRFSAGEELVGVVIVLMADGAVFSTRTDSAGRAEFVGIPCRGYYYRIKLSPGWLAVPSDVIKMRPGVLAEQVVRAVRNEAVSLAATIVLDRDTYAPGDVVRERVTVTNKGAVEVAGILATCGQIGPENELYSNGWGDLDPSVGRGLRLAAGETRSFEFTGTVPPQAWDYGFVVLRCNFAIAGGRDGVPAEDRAAVPGGRGSLAGTLAVAGRVLPGVKVTLTDQATGATAARAVSDADGHFQLPECAAGEYELRLVGPWRFPVATMTVQVFAGRNQDLGSFEVVPGPVQPDPDAPPVAPVVPAPPSSTPVPQASGRPANLADTGVSVRELSLVGVALLAVGGVLVVAGRRNCRWWVRDSRP